MASYRVMIKSTAEVYRSYEVEADTIEEAKNKGWNSFLHHEDPDEYIVEEEEGKEEVIEVVNTDPRLIRL